MENNFEKDGCLKIGFFVFTLPVIIFSIAIIMVVLSFSSNTDLENKSFLFSSIKNITQTIFFLLTGILAYLSYMQAKKSLFNPVKTEIFKDQKTVISRMMSFLSDNSTESDLEDIFGLHDFLIINFVQLYKDYDAIMYNSENFRFFDKISKELPQELKKINRLPFRDMIEANLNNSQKEINEDWENRIISHEVHSKKYIESQKIIKEISSSPFLNEEMKRKVDALIFAIDNNKNLILQILQKYSKSMPTNLPTSESVRLNNLNTIPMFDSYYQSKQNLAPPIKGIKRYVSNYYKIESLID